jgi:hypothetical protein
MSQTKKTLTLGKIKQLVDLNGDSTNFDLSFKVTCHDDTPYKLLVVDQTTLDNTPELQYKESIKSISGKIVADKNVYQNYFLILKSEKPCVVDIELTKKVLPKTPSGPIEHVSDQENTSLSRRTFTSQPSSFPWKKIWLIVLVVVIGMCVLWWLYKRNGKDTEPHIKNQYSLPSPVISPRNISKPALVSPVSSAGDHRGYRPTKIHSFKHTVSPDIMSQTSHQSSVRSDVGNSLLHRLRKFAR